MDNHAALSRRIHGSYRDAVQASLPFGHYIVDIHIEGSGIQQAGGGYYVTLAWYYCVTTNPWPLPLPIPQPGPDPID